MSEADMEAQAHFFAQRFKTEWRICLKRASSDFDRAMQLFWGEVRYLYERIDASCLTYLVCVLRS